jgi:signal transduction histidine kinase
MRYPDGAVIMSSERCRELFGFNVDGEIDFDDFLQRVHPDDRRKFDEVLDSGKESYDVEYRINMPNGDVRWIGSRGEILTNSSGQNVVREASVDITKRRKAENAAHELSHKLMHAQEKERARLARELHDDLSQSLALLSIEIDVMANEQRSDGNKETRFGELTKKVQRLSTDVHRISHELHPAKLNQLGLVATIRGFCRETEAVRGFKVAFEANNIPRALPDDVSLCLYRVVQEALQNAAKHSGASSVNVNLSLNEANLCLSVSDNGTGFDTSKIGTQDSLGLVSMEERVHTVEGTLLITSTPGAGTKVEARIPFAENSRQVGSSRAIAS